MGKAEFDVIAIGDSLIDVLFHCDEIMLEKAGLVKGDWQLITSENEAKRLYSLMDRPETCAGATLPNSLSVISSLGGKTAFMSKVKDDDLGRCFIQDLQKGNIHFANNAVEEGLATGQCLIFIAPDGERTMNTYLGINTEFDAIDIDEDLLSRGKIIYLQAYSFGKEKPMRALRKAIEIAKQHNRQVALALCDKFCVDRDRSDILKTVQDDVDIIIGNQEEYKALYQTADWQDAKEKAVLDTKIVVLTRSGQGAVIATQKEERILPAAPANVVDATGAGDAYAGGFLYAYSQGYDLKKCGEIASLCASEIISCTGAWPQRDLKTLILSEEKRQA